MKFFSITLLLISWLLSQTGYEIAEKISNQPAPDDVKAKLIMTLENTRGNKMESIIRSYTKNKGNKQIMWFLSPPADRGISLYKIEKDSGRDEMKMWLPAFKRVRKISSKKKSQSFMNSDLTFEDLYNRDVDDYTYKLAFSEDSLNYILTSFPNKELESSYGKHVSLINVKTLLVSKEESYGKADNLIKTKLFEFINIDGFNMVEEIYVTDSKTKHITHLKFDQMILNSGLKDSEFHEMNLKRMPVDG